MQNLYNITKNSLYYLCVTFLVDAIPCKRHKRLINRVFGKGCPCDIILAFSHILRSSLLLYRIKWFKYVLITLFHLKKSIFLCLYLFFSFVRVFTFLSVFAIHFCARLYSCAPPYFGILFPSCMTSLSPVIKRDTQI